MVGITKTIKEYNYGSRANCLAAIKEAQDHYLSFHRDSKVLVIYVNGTVYGTYANIEQGRLMFNQIIQALEDNVSVIQLRSENTENVNNEDT